MLDQGGISKKNLIRRHGAVEHEPCGEAILSLAGEKVTLEALDSASESEDLDTTGGLVLGLLDRTPKVGDEVAFDGHVFRVESVDGARIAQLNVRDTSSGKRPGARESNAPDRLAALGSIPRRSSGRARRDRSHPERRPERGGRAGRGWSGHGSRRTGKPAARSAEAPARKSGRFVSQPTSPTAPSDFLGRREVLS